MSLSRTRILTIYSHKVDKVVLFMLILDLYIILLRVIERDFDSGHILPERIFDFNVSTYVWHALISFLTVYGVSKFFFNRESWCFCLLSLSFWTCFLWVLNHYLLSAQHRKKKKEKNIDLSCLWLFMFSESRSWILICTRYLWLRFWPHKFELGLSL